MEEAQNSNGSPLSPPPVTAAPEPPPDPPWEEAGPRIRAQIWIYEHQDQLRAWIAELTEGRAGAFLARVPALARRPLEAIVNERIGKIPEQMISDLGKTSDQDMLELIGKIREFLDFVDPV